MTYPMNVSFYDDQLSVINHNGEPYVPMKLIVENMGLTWQPQLSKLNDNPARWGVTKMVIPTKGGVQTSVCIPMRKLFGWLMTISPNKVNPEIKDKIVRYQNECDDVLWQHWTGKHQRMQDKLNKVFMQESISQAKGSFHGKGLNAQKKEKQTNERAILYLQTLIQPELTNFKTATKAVF